MARAAHAQTTGGHAVQAYRGVAVLADTGWDRRFLNTDPVARTSDVVAGLCRTTLQPHANVTKIAHAVGSSIQHDTASRPATVHSETVGHAGRPDGAVARVALAEGVPLGIKEAFTMSRTSFCLTGPQSFRGFRPFRASRAGDQKQEKAQHGGQPGVAPRR